MELNLLQINDAIKHIRYLYIEPAPFIYYIEENPTFIKRIDAVMDYIQNNSLSVVTSVLTLTEVLIHPLRKKQSKIAQEYREILTNSQNILLTPVNNNIAEKAADLRAQYSIRTPDALHIATAIESVSDAVLTNDSQLKRIREIPIILLDDLDNPT